MNDTGMFGGFWQQPHPVPVTDDNMRAAVLSQYLEFVSETQNQFRYIIQHMLEPAERRPARRQEAGGLSGGLDFFRTFSDVRFHSPQTPGERTGGSAAPGTARIRIGQAIPQVGSILDRIQAFLNTSGRERNRASAREIERATETVDYEPQTQEMCPISYSQFEEGQPVMRIRHCGHIFEPSSLRTWLRISSKCPVCRYDIRTYVPNAAGGTEGGGDNGDDGEREAPVADPDEVTASPATPTSDGPDEDASILEATFAEYRM
jgi:hypothetical protein